MSLGGQRSQTFNDAAAANYDDASAFIAVVTGNEGQNTNAYSPSSEPKAFTVGAIDQSDNITYYYNYGFLVDAFGPGDAINSTWPGNKYVSFSATTRTTSLLTERSNSIQERAWPLHTLSVWRHTS